MTIKVVILAASNNMNMNNICNMRITLNPWETCLLGWGYRLQQMVMLGRWRLAAPKC
jgi:hypothetical protein